MEAFFRRDANQRYVAEFHFEMDCDRRSLNECTFQRSYVRYTLNVSSGNEKLLLFKYGNKKVIRCHVTTIRWMTHSICGFFEHSKIQLETQIVITKSCFPHFLVGNWQTNGYVPLRIYFSTYFWWYAQFFRKTAIICLDVLHVRITFIRFDSSLNIHTANCYLQFINPRSLSLAAMP